MSAHRLTVELPESVFQKLARIAEVTRQSPESLAAQSIISNLPPAAENAPAQMQAELLLMQALEVDELLKVANSKIPPPQQQRHLALLEKNHDDSLTEEEQRELADLRLAADQMMLRKAYAWAVLRWRGYPVPALDELPLV